MYIGQMTGSKQATAVDSKVRSVVIFFAYRLGGRRPLNAVRIMKLAYLSELKSLERRGKKLTHAMYKNWFYGPYSEEVGRAMERAAPEVNLTMRVTPQGRTGKFLGPAKSRVRVDLSKDELGILEEVADEWGFIDNETLVAQTKQSPPFKWTKRGDRIPFDEYGEFLARLDRAKRGELGKVVVLRSEADIREFAR